MEYMIVDDGDTREPPSWEAIEQRAAEPETSDFYVPGAARKLMSRKRFVSVKLLKRIFTTKSAPDVPLVYALVARAIDEQSLFPRYGYHYHAVLNNWFRVACARSSRELMSSIVRWWTKHRRIPPKTFIIACMRLCMRSTDNVAVDRALCIRGVFDIIASHKARDWFDEIQTDMFLAAMYAWDTSVVRFLCEWYSDRLHSDVHLVYLEAISRGFTDFVRLVGDVPMYRTHRIDWVKFRHCFSTFRHFSRKSKRSMWADIIDCLAIACEQNASFSTGFTYNVATRVFSSWLPQYNGDTKSVLRLRPLMERATSITADEWRALVLECDVRAVDVLECATACDEAIERRATRLLCALIEHGHVPNDRAAALGCLIDGPAKISAVEKLFAVDGGVREKKRARPNE